MIEDAIDDLMQVYVIPLGLTILWGVLAGLAALVILRAIAAAITRSRSRSKQVVKRLGTPVFALVLVTVMWSAATVMRIPRRWEENVTGNIHHTMQIVTIIAVAWLLIALVQAVSDALLARFKTDKATERRARRVQMQVQLMRRILSALIVVMAIGSVLFTFEQLRIAGTSLLASAGLVSVVAGLAATSALTNVFAGMQLAFSGAINLHDIVVVEDEWGRIEEITLTYVVVRIWDDRRLVLPSTYFTTTPFTNYTRTTIEKYGTIFMHVDWTVPLDEMREELQRIVEDSELWDGRLAILQVTDAREGLLEIRVIVSVDDAAITADLVNHVRELLVVWIKENHPSAIPYQRVRESQEPLPKSKKTRREPTGSTPKQGLFYGSDEAEARREQFTKPMDVVQAESTLEDAEEVVGELDGPDDEKV